MKILFFIRTLNNSAGTEKLTTLLSNYFDDIGHEVAVLSWKDGTKQFFPTNKGVELFKLFDNPDLNIYATYPKALVLYTKFLKKYKPDLIIDVCTASSLLSIPAASFFKSIKVVSWEHFNTSVKWNPVTSDLSRWLVAKYAEAVIVLTDTDKQNFEEKFHAKKVRKILNPAPVTSDSRADMDNKTVIAIGRFTNQKGFDLLLKSWKLIIEKRTDWRLKIVGNGELRPDILALANELNISDSIDFTEPTLSIQDHYLSSSIFALSSRFEGLPLVLLEAKAYGLPIVSYDCETGPRDVVRDGIDGFLVKPEDTVAFAEKLLTLIDDMELRKRFSASAVQDVGRFSVGQFFDSWNNFLETV